eukprot:13998-Chlamydomonas_euryale.AAC.3
MVHELLRTRFDVREDHDELFVRQSILFGDFLRMGVPHEERVYEEVSDGKRLLALLGDYLDEYNQEHKATLQLVFFVDAVQHIRQALGKSILCIAAPTRIRPHRRPKILAPPPESSRREPLSAAPRWMLRRNGVENSRPLQYTCLARPIHFFTTT